MCIAAIAIGVHPEYPFICIANRDEFHNRPTAPLQQITAATGSLWAGIDLQSGGNWLGVSERGQFALLTNVRNSALNMPESAPTRGQLVSQYLQLGLDPSPEESLKYAGFNLIHGKLQKLQFQCASNQGLKLKNGVPFAQALTEGVHTLSNGHLNGAWPKTLRLRLGLERALGNACANTLSQTELESRLFDLLQDTTQAEDKDLPNTGIPYDWEKMLSAIKIVSPLYGTRSCAVVLFNKSGRISFTETTLDPEGRETGRQHVAFVLPPNP